MSNPKSSPQNAGSSRPENVRPAGGPSGKMQAAALTRPATTLTSVAVVEDNRDFRVTLENYLNEAPGYRCVCACGSAEGALQTLPRLLPGVVLMHPDPADILRAIQEVKHGGAPMSAQIARQVVQSFREELRELPKVEGLSEREEEILQQLSKGYSTKEIADRSSVSVNTVRTHLQHIYDKLHVRSRTEAVLKYLQDDGGH